jgi:hypothetical protein
VNQGWDAISDVADDVDGLITADRVRLSALEAGGPWAPLHALKPTFETVSGSNVLQLDDHLFVDLVAGRRYAIDAWLELVGTVGNGGFKQTWWTTGTITGSRRMCLAPGFTGDVNAVAWGADRAIGGVGSGACLHEAFTVDCTVSGRLTLRWAQNTAAASTSVNTGSLLTARRLS